MIMPSTREKKAADMVGGSDQEREESEEEITSEKEMETTRGEDSIEFRKCTEIQVETYGGRI